MPAHMWDLLARASPADLYCKRANWSDIAIFYFANYIAHCATVKPYPAETYGELSVAIAATLFLPSSGVSRAMDSINRRTRFRPGNELEKAAIAGSLCMVVRSADWVPESGDIIRNIRYDSHTTLEYRSKTNVAASVTATSNDPLQDAEDVELLSSAFESRYRPPMSREPSARELDLPYAVQSPPWLIDAKYRTSHKPRRIKDRRCHIHGVFSLPKGYEFAYVPSGAAVVINDTLDAARGTKLFYEMSSSYSFTKAAIAIIQTVYGSISLYRARGDQVNRFGYAAFGLTVIPYILMSVLNLLGQIATPDYPTLYMVHSEEMDEARRRGAVFDGVIGTIPTQDAKAVDEDHLIVGQSSGPWEVLSSGISFGEPTYRLRNTAWGSRENTAPEILKLRPLRGYTANESVWIPSCSRIASRKAKDTNVDSRIHWREGEYLARRSPTSVTLLVLGPLLCGAVSIAIVGILTKFHRGTESSSIERGFAMSWLVVGMLFGALSRYVTNYLLRGGDWWSFIGRFIGFVFLFGIFIVPAIGGFVMVGNMIIKFGACTRLS